VTAVDLDEKAVSLARENAVLNAAAIDFRHADGFDFLRAAQAASFDLVVLDPPKFAAGRAEIAGALERYRDLNALAAKAICPGGTLITCSCSGPVSEARFQEAVLLGARRSGVELILCEAGGASPDHPVLPEFPEGRYLKVLTFRRR
jgi:23S rRNA (cytosine1962-C5)-methyltransferase